MPVRKYDKALLDQAADLRETGMSCSAIGRRLGMSTGAVKWHCLRLGADSPNTTTNTEKPQGPMVYRRSGHMVRRFTEDEDRRLVELDRAGARLSDMARELGRPPNSIYGRLMTLARNEARREATS